MRRIRSRVAGLDVHRDTVVACCQIAHPNQSVEVTKQSFSTTSKGLGELAAWLRDAGVETVALEALPLSEKWDTCCSSTLIRASQKDSQSCRFSTKRLRPIRPILER